MSQVHNFYVKGWFSWIARVNLFLIKKNMELKEIISCVEKFHDSFKIGNNYTPTIDISNAEKELRFNLMKEENEEYLEAAGSPASSDDNSDNDENGNPLPLKK